VPGHIQQSFISPEEKAREMIELCARQYADRDPFVNLAVSGGTDSTVAADVWARLAPEHGLDPDAITFINTGAYIPQSRLTAMVLADMHDLEFIEQGYRKRRDSLAHRVLGNGWCGGYGGSPATGGHGLEWANRKDKPMQEIYVTIDGFQVWVSGARKAESRKRMSNIPDSGLGEDRPRRVWAAVIGGWTDHEKRQYIRERGLPVSEAYVFLGYSGECTACAFDDAGVLDGIDLLSPELGHALRTLTVWLYMRARRGGVDIDPKQLCWGWDPDGEPDGPKVPDDAQRWVGCDPETCADREAPSWVRDLLADQLVTRSDVERYWAGGDLPTRFPMA